MSHSVTPGAEVAEVKACMVLTALGPGLSLTGQDPRWNFWSQSAAGRTQLAQHLLFQAVLGWGFERQGGQWLSSRVWG